MEKTDYKKALKHLYGASSSKVQFVSVPAMNFLMVEGKGAPGGKTHTEAIEALYPLAYTIKFASKTRFDVDYVVPPLEGLWWAQDMTDFIKGNRAQWKWAMMIMVPAHITDAVVDEAVSQVSAKKNPAALGKVVFQPFSEGDCAQILHIGPFSNEAQTIQTLHSAIEGEGYSLAGKHHEIYLSDIRRVSPDRYRTILRQPLSR